MPDLFALMPALEGSHPLLTGQRIALIGVSVLLRDDDAWYFEVQRPRYWARRPGGVLSVGIGGIGGGLHAGEDVLGALRREVREELGVDVALEVPPHTVLLHQWRVAGYLEVPSGLPEPEACPYMVNLLPPQLGGSEMPDALARVTFLGRPLGRPRRGDIFGLLTVASGVLSEFLDASEWPGEAVQAHPGLGLDLASALPPNGVLRPVLTAQAFRVVMGRGPKPGG